MQAVINFCEAIPELEGGLTPLVAQLASLTDLDVGAVSLIVRPTAFGNRPPELTYRIVIKAATLAIADHLCQLGMPRNDAYRMMARELVLANFDLRGHRGSKDLAILWGWRQSLSRKGSSSQLVNTYNAFRKLFVELDYASTHEASSELRAKLRNLIEGSRPALK